MSKIVKKVEPNKTSHHQERKTTAVKIGGGGGGIGAVLLLGGALATAAFVSAFIRKRGRSSGEYRRRQNKNPRPESGEQKERDGARKGENFVVLNKYSNTYEHRYSSNGETELAMFENAPDSSTQDLKGSRAEMDGGIIAGGIDDVEAGEQSIVSSIPKVVENCAVSGGSVAMDEGFCSMIEKLPSEPEPIIKQDFLSKSREEIKDFDQVYTEEERAESAGGDSEATKVHSDSLKAEKNENWKEKGEESIEKIEIVSGGIVAGRHGAVLSMSETQMVELNTVKEGAEIVKKVLVADEVVEGIHGDGVCMGCVEDELVRKQEIHEGCEDVIVYRGCKGDGEEIDCVDEQENGCMGAPKLRLPVLEDEATSGTEEDAAMVEVAESQETGVDHDQNKGQGVEEELISSENIESKKEAAELYDISVQCAVDQAEQHKGNFEIDVTQEVKDAVETIESGIASVKNDLVNYDSYEETDLSNKAEETSSTGNFVDQIRPEESMQESSKQPLIVGEVEGKILEDSLTKETKNGSFNHQVLTEECNSKKKYMVKLGKLNGHHTVKPSRRAVLIGVLSVLSSLSCSWVFGLSLIKLCAVLFLSMALSKIHR